MIDAAMALLSAGVFVGSVASLVLKARRPRRKLGVTITTDEGSIRIEDVRNLTPADAKRILAALKDKLPDSTRAEVGAG